MRSDIDLLAFALSFLNSFLALHTLDESFFDLVETLELYSILLLWDWYLWLDCTHLLDKLLAIVITLLTIFILINLLVTWVLNNLLKITLYPCHATFAYFLLASWFVNPSRFYLFLFLIRIHIAQFKLLFIILMMLLLIWLLVALQVFVLIEEVVNLILGEQTTFGSAGHLVEATRLLLRLVILWIVHLLIFIVFFVGVASFW